MKIFEIAIAALVFAWAASAAHAQRGVAATFTTDEITIITRYYESAQDRPQSRREGRLPRGIAKNLSRGKPLPPGIAKRALPADLTARLPAAPAGFERIVVAGKILLIETATQVVHDILTDALFR
jgi:hypothetical protein